jgi:hypothetical protein
VLAVGRLPLRIARFCLFASTAVTGALLTFLSLSEIEHEVGIGRVEARATMLVGCGFVLIWFVRNGRVRISLRCRQVHRHTTRGRYKGPSAFGFLLGLGWWTWVSSPFFWVGLTVTTLQGQALPAALVYGLGRSVTGLYAVFAPDRVRDGVDPVQLGFRIGSVLFTLTPWITVAAVGFTLAGAVR